MWHGLDISKWDADIDLTAWRDIRGIDFVIIKAGGNEVGRYSDAWFETNYRKAVAAGLHVGAYYYTTTCNTAEARGDAEHFAQLLSGKQFDMPCYMDVEDGRQFALSQRDLTDVVKAFCDRLRELGYYAGIYTGGYAYQGNMFGPSELSDYADWIAWWREAWPNECGDVGMHQVGGIRLSDGDVVYDDVSGYHDYDRCIIDYPSRINNGQTIQPSTSEPVFEGNGGTIEDVMREAYADLGYYAPDDPERGSKAGRYCAELLGEDWLAGPSWEIWWCCMWVSMILDKANVHCPGFPSQNTDVALNGGAYSRAIDKYDVQRGDIVIFDWDWDGATDHIGFATSSWDGSGFSTIEGNVGNAVQEKYRNMQNVAYVIRPEYGGAGHQTIEPGADTTAKNNRDGGKLDIDGIGGWNTVIDMQHCLGTLEDGIISGQDRGNKEFHWGMSAVEYGYYGSKLVMVLQSIIGAGIDGHWGRETSTKFQQWLNAKGYPVDIDGYFGRQSVSALQQCINDGNFGR